MSYQDICNIDADVVMRRKYSIGDIFENKARCLLCGDVIMSVNRHDYVTCKCGNLSVDGGSWYIKRVVCKGYWEELSVFYHII